MLHYKQKYSEIKIGEKFPKSPKKKKDFHLFLEDVKEFLEFTEEFCVRFEVHKVVENPGVHDLHCLQK